MPLAQTDVLLIQHSVPMTALAIPSSAGSPAQALSAIHSPHYLPIPRTAVLGVVKGISLQEPFVDLLSINLFDPFLILLTPSNSTPPCGSKLQKFNHPLCKEALYLFQTNPLLVSPSDLSSSTAAFGEQEFYIQLTYCLCVLVTHQYNPPHTIFLQRKSPSLFSLSKSAALFSFAFLLLFPYTLITLHSPKRHKPYLHKILISSNTASTTLFSLPFLMLRLLLTFLVEAALKA